MSAKICHITTVHYAKDTRILHRECVSLAENGFDVHLIVAEQEDFEHKGVKVHNINVGAANRLQRMRKTTQVAFQKALSLKAGLYHFHDPELLPVGRKLQKAGYPVIYDSHEHVPHQIRTKAYLPKLLRPIIASIYEIYENRMARKMNAIITATDLVQQRFLPMNQNTVAVNNYPRLDTLHPAKPGTPKTYDVTYVGLINEIRGIRPLLDALTKPGDWKLCLVGYFQNQALEAEMKAHPGWKRVQFLGRKSRTEVAEILAQSKIGLVTFLPAPNHNKNQPNKLFEYMAAGLPVVCSHFERWKKIVEGADCGYCVDPANPTEIAQQVNQLLESPTAREKFGINARKAMEEKYNWSTEEAKLIGLYQQLLNASK